MLMLSGCTAPIVKTTDAPAGDEYVTWLPKYFKTATNERLPPPTELWWKEFGSDELNEFVDIAIANNFDLRVAIARVTQARAQVDVVNAALFPVLDLVPAYAIQAPSAGIGSAGLTTQWQSRSSYQLGALASYEVDIWGKKGFNTQSAISQALASEFSRDAIALSLVGDVATNYFQVLSLNERIVVGERNLIEIRKISKGLKRRLDMGDSTLIDLSQQLILQNNTEALVISQKLQRDDAINRLATLMGRTPSSIKVKMETLESLNVALVQPGLPSELLCRRPDIRRAEAMLESSQADLYSARANILPSFALTGGGGYGSFALSTITSPQSFFYNFGASIVAHVFDGGKRRAEERVADAKNVEMLETYAATVLAALRDVESSLSGIHYTAEGYGYSNQARLQAQKLATMSARVVELGGMDYVQLYEIQRSVFTAEDAAINAKFDQLRASVSLFKAIGGGMTYKGDTCKGGGKLPPADPMWVERQHSFSSPVVADNPQSTVKNTGSASSKPAAIKTLNPNFPTGDTAPLSKPVFVPVVQPAATVNSTPLGS